MPGIRNFSRQRPRPRRRGRRSRSPRSRRSGAAARSSGGARRARTPPRPRARSGPRAATILIDEPGRARECGDRPRDPAPGLKTRGRFAGVGAAVVLTGAGRRRRAGARGAPARAVELADLGGDAAGRGLEGLRGRHRAAPFVERTQAWPRSLQTEFICGMFGIGTPPFGRAGTARGPGRPTFALMFAGGRPFAAASCVCADGVAMKLVTRSFAAESTPCAVANFVTMKPCTPRNGTDGLHDRGHLDDLERQAALLERVGVPRAGDPERASGP